MPRTVLANMHTLEEDGSFFLHNISTDVTKKNGDILVWHTRVIGGKDLVAKLPCRDVIALPGNQGFALKFSNAVYHEYGIKFMGARPGIGYLCLTFRTDSVTDGTLVSNIDLDSPDYPFHEVSASSKKILLWGPKGDEMNTVEIMHNWSEWTTLFIQWHTTDKYTEGVYQVNGNDTVLEGKFVFDKFWAASSGINVGARSSKERFFQAY